jgi:hypothetical protein
VTREVDPRQEVWEDVLEHGVTTLGLHPPGNEIPGQGAVVRPAGDSVEAMVLRDPAYLLVHLIADSDSKKALKGGFERVDAHEEKVEKARQKWEKEKEKRAKKAKKDKKASKEDGGAAAEEAEEGSEEELAPFEPPAPADDVAPFQRLRSGELRALVSIRKAADYLHFRDALGDEPMQWDLRVPMYGESDLFEILEELAQAQARVVLESELVLQAATRNRRNLPAELTRAGVPVVLLPEEDSLDGLERWRTDVALLVKAGLDREAALAAVTLEPAEQLGDAERVGSLEAGKDANLVFTSGDPLEPTSRIEAVMLEGRFVHGLEDIR